MAPLARMERVERWFRGVSRAGAQHGPAPSPPARSVEKPFLKPVVVAGPNTGERAALLARLLSEFPDVFGVPRAHTTRDPAAERRAHDAADGASPAPRGAGQRGVLAAAGRAKARLHASDATALAQLNNTVLMLLDAPTLIITSGDELGLPEGLPSSRARTPHTPSAGAPDALPAGCGTSNSGAQHAGEQQPAAPPPVILDREEFDAHVGGGRFLEWHGDAFVHPLAAQRTGHTLEDVQAVVREGASAPLGWGPAGRPAYRPAGPLAGLQGGPCRAARMALCVTAAAHHPRAVRLLHAVPLLCIGKLPLLGLESDGAEALKQRGVDCLTIFLMPPSAEVHEARLRAWLSESDADIAAQQVRRTRGLEAWGLGRRRPCLAWSSSAG